MKALKYLSFVGKVAGLAELTPSLASARKVPSRTQKLAA
jgi:hypothetical protein